MTITARQGLQPSCSSCLAMQTHSFHLISAGPEQKDSLAGSCQTPLKSHLCHPQWPAEGIFLVEWSLGLETAVHWSRILFYVTSLCFKADKPQKMPTKGEKPLLLSVPTLSLKKKRWLLLPPPKKKSSPDFQLPSNSKMSVSLARESLARGEEATEVATAIHKHLLTQELRQLSSEMCCSMLLSTGELWGEMLC